MKNLKKKLDNSKISKSQMFDYEQACLSMGLNRVWAEIQDLKAESQDLKDKDLKDGEYCD